MTTRMKIKQNLDRRIEAKFKYFSHRLASELKTSTEHVDCVVKNVLNYDDWERDNWRAERQSEIGR